MTGTKVSLASVPNLRDLDGWPTKDGRQVRMGLLYLTDGLQLDTARLGALRAGFVQ
jgi:hypothetical protein